MNVTPHVAQNTRGRSSAVDGRTTRHGGYAASQRIRKRIEEALPGPTLWAGPRSLWPARSAPDRPFACSFSLRQTRPKFPNDFYAGKSLACSIATFAAG